MFLINPYIYGSVSYLVDDYSPVVAYSLERLRSDNAVVARLRNNVGTEANFTAEEITDGTVVAWGGGSVSVAKWFNQGTGGATYDVYQSSAGFQPRLIIGGVMVMRNGKPSFLFQTSDSLLSTTSPFGQVSNSFFAVSSASTTNTVGTIMSLSTTTPQSLRIFQDARTSTQRNLVINNTSGTLYAADMSTTRTAADTLTLLSSFVDASKGMSGFDNGVTGGTDTFTGTWTNDAMRLGTQSTGVTYLNGTISEFIGFATDEISNRTDIETNINDRYSIY